MSIYRKLLLVAFFAACGVVVYNTSLINAFAKSVDEGCTIRIHCGVNKDSCMTNQEAIEAEQFCMSHSCGMCFNAPEDKCFQNHGYCKRNSSGCDWREDKQLTECVKGFSKKPEKYDPNWNIIPKGSNIKLVPFEDWNKEVQKRSNSN